MSRRLIDITPLIDECDEIIGIEWNHKVAPQSWADAEEGFRQRLLDTPPLMLWKWSDVRIASGGTV